MEYIEDILGIKVTYKAVAIKHLANYINSRYSFKEAYLDNIKTIFVYPKRELEQISSLKKQLSIIHEAVNCPLVLILNKIDYRQRTYLLNAKIPFVVERKQIYLPFMAIYLQERCDNLYIEEEILPSSQMLLLYFIYNRNKDLSTAQAARQLALTPTSLSRASKQLEQLNILKCRKMGVEKILYCDKSSRELFEQATNILTNPIKRTVYVPKDRINEKLLKSGYTALSNYSMLANSYIECYATNKVSYYDKIGTNRLYDSKTQVEVQLWKYDPYKLSTSDTVDYLSLALSLKEDTDERVEEALETMLNDLWRELDDKRIR